MDQHHDEHYLRAVTELGDTHCVETNQAIFAGKHIKLVEKGTRVNSSLFEHLVQHKLAPPIEQCLSVDKAVSQYSLLADAERQLQEALDFPLLEVRPDFRERMLHAFLGIPLPPPLAFKLTVARDQRPEVYEHALRIALVALYLALQTQRLAEPELVKLAAAALFHDIGYLHIAPEMLQPDHRMERNERLHLYAHPIAAYLILRDCPQYHPHIDRQVLEHHERLDGSGYPRGLHDADISPGGRILMLAEVAWAAFEKNRQPRSLAKISVLLKLNQKKFDRKLGDLLLSSLNSMQREAQTEDESWAALPERLEKLSRVFLEWEVAKSLCYANASPQHGSPLVDFVDQQLSSLQLTLQSVGVGMESTTALPAMLGNDLQALQELNLVAAETRWQINTVAHEVLRRAQEAPQAGEAMPAALGEWLEQSEKNLLQW